MSYLDVPRLHFAGRFRSDPSTVNNTAAHFEPSQQAPDPHPEWNWNPDGANFWKFEDCTVRRVVYGDGTVCDDAAADPIVGAWVGGTDNPFPAKLADLDVEQQYVPGIFGLRLRFGNRGGTDFFEGDFRPISPFDMWYRASIGPRSGDPDSAFFQTLLEELRWARRIDSQFLRELQAASPEALSVKMVTDGYDKITTSPGFTTGRMVGTVGPAHPGEPVHCLAGRLLRPPTPGASQFDGTPFFYAPFRVDPERRRVLVDLGNSNTLTKIRGGPEDVGDLRLAALPKTGDPKLLGRIDYREDGLYETTAGVQELAIADDELALVGQTPLGIVRVDGDEKLTKVFLREDSEGRNLRADQFIFRLNPGESAEVRFVATAFGQPAAGVGIDFELDKEILDRVGLVVDDIAVGVPEEALDFPTSVTTDPDGRAKAVITGGDPGKPRLDGWIDGQVYTVAYRWPGEENPDKQCFLSVRVFDRHPVPEKPTWKDDVGPILRQYAKLFPYMKRLFDLGDCGTVQQNGDMLRYFLTLPQTHPGYMPVTRDLSRDKLKMILRWIDQGMAE